MNEIQEVLTEVTIHSPQTQIRGVVSPNVEMRPWLAGFPKCQALDQYRIIHIGFQSTFAPMRVVRTKQTSTYFLACIGGRGRVRAGGTTPTC